MTERWAFYPPYQNSYSVSTSGRVRSETRLIASPRGGFQKLVGRVLKQYVTDDGYCSVCLSLSGKVKRWSVHRLVLETFVGPCPEGMECRHLDGNPNNNHLDNLAWGTPVENAEDKKSHGTYFTGTDLPWAKLRNPRVQVPAIHAFYRGGKTLREIGTLFGIGGATVLAILKGESYKEYQPQVKAVIRPAKPIGERCHKAKVTEDDVLEIRAKYRAGTTVADLAREYGLGWSATSSICQGTTWKHVT